jgi:hypothetical protein
MEHIMKIEECVPWSYPKMEQQQSQELPSQMAFTYYFGTSCSFFWGRRPMSPLSVAREDNRLRFLWGDDVYDSQHYDSDM